MKVDNLLPLISDITIHSESNGIIVTYQVNKPIEKLTLTLGPEVSDKSFDSSFGEGVLTLPSKLGMNTYKIDFKKLGLGKNITLLFKSQNPYFTMPIIDHHHAMNSTTDVIGFLLNEDGTPLLNEDGSKILVETPKNRKQ